MPSLAQTHVFLEADHGKHILSTVLPDYIKFIRFAEYYIEKNKSGIVGMITNNTFLDGIIHRQMRKHLLEIFDEIYVLDLHGNSKKKEKAFDGSKDENVFDIQQGVTISIMIRNSDNKKRLGNIKFAEIYGTRVHKFYTLDEMELNSIKWTTIKPFEPNYFFVLKDFGLQENYNPGFRLNDLFIEFGTGIKFRKDNLLVKNHFSSDSVKELLQNMNEMDNNNIYTKYNFKDTHDWKLTNKKKLFVNDNIKDIQQVQYRPFDFRFTYYPLDKINEIIPRGDSRWNLMRNFLVDQNNIGIISTRQLSTFDYQHIFITRSLVDMCLISLQTKETSYVFPLYYFLIDGTKIPNLKKEIVEEIEKIVGKVSPENILDYIYAILHSPSYRKKYKEFLKIDFPRVPYPKDKESFKNLVKLGTELRSLHLLDSSKVNQYITTYPVNGSDEVEKIIYKESKVFINKSQYFGNVPESAWNFYIGGYQPAQKWLKDRKGRPLTNQDIEHYQKIIVVLVETERIMKEIDKEIII